MKEKKLAKILINDAIKYYNDGMTLFPQIVIDKEEYNDIDINILSVELSKEEFILVDGMNAPEPYSFFPEQQRKRKWFIYKKI